jgi:SET domain-containing protein
MDSRKVVVRRTRKYGRAVFALNPLRKGEIVAVFDGEIYDDDFDDWNDDLYNHAIQFDKAMWRDSKGIARWINHSCDPNCGIKDLFKVVAMRAIAPGEEITWDYEMTEKNPHWRMKCRCGSPLCRKVIGSYANMPRKTRLKYKGYISEWLTRGRSRST